MVRFLLNGTIVSNPINWETLKCKVKRGDDIEAVLLTIEGRYDFADDGYDLIVDAINDNGFCDEISVSIQQECTASFVEIFRGKIFVADIIINKKNCVASCEVLDQSFFAMIENNIGVKATIDAGISKNNTVITIPNSYLVDFTNLTNPLTYNVLNVPCYRVEEVFRYMIEFMTDGQISLTSTLFGVGGDWEGLCITTGERMRTVTATQFTEFDFEELFNEINNRIPLIMFIQDPFTNPVVRIEERGFATQNTLVLSLTDIYEIVQSFDSDKIYSSIKFGCPTFGGFSITIPDNITFYTHKVEEFGFISNCNVNRDLDLSCDWSVSTSLIVSSYAGNQSFDDNIFLIDTTYTNSTNGITKYENYLNLSSNPFWYNPRLTNDKISERYVDFIPSSFASFFAPSGTGTFKAFNGATATLVGSTTNPDFNFTNVAYNIGSDFNGTDRFVSPELGVYDFRVFFDLNTTILPKSFRAALDIYDNLNVYRGQRPMITSSGTSNVLGLGSQQFIGTAEATLPPSWYCVVRVVSGGAGTTNVLVSSYWECYQNTIAGGIYQEVDSGNYAIYLYDFEYPLSYEQWELIISNPIGYINFAMNGDETKRGWIKEASYDYIKSIATFRLITSKLAQNAT